LAQKEIRTSERKKESYREKEGQRDRDISSWYLYWQFGIVAKGDNVNTYQPTSTLFNKINGSNRLLVSALAVISERERERARARYRETETERYCTS
jgi:hypothetical protein